MRSTKNSIEMRLHRSASLSSSSSNFSFYNRVPPGASVSAFIPETQFMHISDEPIQATRAMDAYIFPNHLKHWIGYSGKEFLLSFSGMFPVYIIDQNHINESLFQFWIKRWITHDN